MPRVEEAHGPRIGLHAEEEEGREAVGQAVAAEEAVHPPPHLGDGPLPLHVARIGPEGRLELGHEEGRAQPLARHVPEGEPRGALGQGHEVHEVATHVVGGPREEPAVPAPDVGALVGHEGQLHGPPHGQFVPGQELVLELQHEDHEEDQVAELAEGEAQLELVVAEIDVPLDDEPDGHDEHEAPGGCEAHDEALEEPPGDGEDPLDPPHALELGAGLIVQVEVVEVVQVPLEMEAQVTALEVPQDRPAHALDLLRGGVGLLPFGLLLIRAHEAPPRTGAGAARRKRSQRAEARAAPPAAATTGKSSTMYLGSGFGMEDRKASLGMNRRATRTTQRLHSGERHQTHAPARPRPV